jgi:hypothetical protein
VPHVGRAIRACIDRQANMNSQAFEHLKRPMIFYLLRS